MLATIPVVMDLRSDPNIPMLLLRCGLKKHNKSNKSEHHWKVQVGRVITPCFLRGLYSTLNLPLCGSMIDPPCVLDAKRKCRHDWAGYTTASMLCVQGLGLTVWGILLGLGHKGSPRVEGSASLAFNLDNEHTLAVCILSRQRGCFKHLAFAMYQSYSHF